MSKKVNPDGPVTPEAIGEDAIKTVHAPVQSEIKTETESEIAEVADQQVVRVLRAYPDYPTLYVDHQGGAYTPDTAASLREGAVLYKNPFYEPSKMKR